MNAENAEQLMFISAGLSLIILPEQDVSGMIDIDMSAYTDRAPINPETGTRVRSISAAAAAAGEVMLDRARKGSAMRVERQRRRQLKLLSGEDPENSADNNYSRLSLLSSTTAATAVVPATASSTTAKPTTTVPPGSSRTAVAPNANAVPLSSTTQQKAIIPTPILISKTVKKPTPPKPATPTLPSPANVRAIRARVQASMSVQTLLSLNPSAEELRIDGKSSASTLALIERGVGTTYGPNNSSSSKTHQQRYRHPFPESHGARRRALTPGAAVKTTKDSTVTTAPTPFLHPAYISMALPPLPTARERRTKKKISVLPCSKACSSRARTAIRSVLDQLMPVVKNDGNGTKDLRQKEANDIVDDSDKFTRPRKRRITEISFLHGLQNFGEAAGTDSNNKGTELTATLSLTTETPKKESNPMDPILAFNVLLAVGLLKPSTSEEDVETRNFQSRLDVSLFDVAEKRAMGEEGGQSRRSIAKLRSLSKKFATKKRTFTEAFFDFDPVTEQQRLSPRKTTTLSEISQSEPHPNPSQQKNPNAVENVTASTATANNLNKPSAEAAAAKEMDIDSNNPNNEEAKSESIQSPPVVAIRGGGEALTDASDRSNIGGQPQGAGQQARNGTHNNQDAAGGQPGQAARPMNVPANQQVQSNNTVHPADMATHRMVWDDGSHQPLVLLNPQMARTDQGYALAPTAHHSPLMQHANGVANAQRNARMQGQLQSAEHYHHHTTSAIQLAHHLRHATAAIQRLPPHGHPAAGDLEAYIGGLHSQPAAAYDWSSINAANAAVAATHSSLAALGLNPHRAMVNFSVQDRARVLLAREQQTAAAAAAAHAAAAHRQQTMSSQQAVAFLGGAANHGYAPTPSPHYQHIGGPTAATAALLNSSAARIGHSGMAQVHPVQQVPRLQQVNPDQRNSLVTKSEQSSKKDARSSKEGKSDQNSRKDQASRKDQKKENAKRENASKKDGSAGQKASSSNIEVPASRKRKLSDQERIEAQAQKRGTSSDKSSPAKASDQKRTEAAPSVTKSVQGAPVVVSSSIRQDAQVAATSHTMADKTKDPPRNDNNKKESDAPSQPKATPANLPLSKDSSSASSALSSKTPAQPQKSMIPSESTADVHMEDATSSSPQGTGGMQFFVPPAPPGISAEVASLVLAARSFEAIEFMKNSEIPTNATSLVDYLIAVGTAVPIPKALVANPFKDRMSAQMLKNNSLGSIPALSREVSTKQKDIGTDRETQIHLPMSLPL
jgi:hypothetical protein